MLLQQFCCFVVKLLMCLIATSHHSVVLLELAKIVAFWMCLWLMLFTVFSLISLTWCIVNSFQFPSHDTSLSLKHWARQLSSFCHILSDQYFSIFSIFAYVYICSFVFKSVFLLVICMVCVLPLGVINDDDYTSHCCVMSRWMKNITHLITCWNS